jgi:hypothetical protein
VRICVPFDTVEGGLVAPREAPAPYHVVYGGVTEGDVGTERDLSVGFSQVSLSSLSMTQNSSQYDGIW